MKQTISAQNAPAAIGPYCHAKLVGGMIFTSGQLGLDPATGELREGVEAQTKQSLENLGAVLSAAGMSYGDVVKTTVFLANMEDFGAVNAVYAGFFPVDPPARSWVGVKTLPRGGVVEIEIVAAQG